jgi:hypothetical protein
MSLASGSADLSRGGTREGCLDPQTLAAFIDQTLDHAARARVEEHLADCADCRDLLAESVRTLEELPDIPDTPASRALSPTEASSRRRLGWWWIPMSGVMAAAAVVLLVVTPWRAWLGLDRTDADPSTLRVELADAGKTVRFIEPRLSGFAYHPYLTSRSTRVGPPPRPPDVERAAARIELWARSHPSPDADDLLAVARLTSADHDGAIALLERSVAEHPQSATMLNDLAAAYIDRGLLSRIDDLRKGLALARQAQTLDPNLLEARFNEALALSKLVSSGNATREDAHDAWNRYLASDAHSEWAAEARRRAAELPDQ